VVAVLSATTLPEGDAIASVTLIVYGIVAGAGECIDVQLETGANTITATLLITQGRTASDTANVIVRDKTPPVITAAIIQASPAWQSPGCSLIFSRIRGLVAGVGDCQLTVVPGRVLRMGAGKAFCFKEGRYSRDTAYYQSRFTPKYKVRAESFRSLSSSLSVLLLFRSSFAPLVASPTAAPMTLTPCSGMPINSSESRAKVRSEFLTTFRLCLEAASYSSRGTFVSTPCSCGCLNPH